MNNPRNGKIARLPEALRNQLNRRLADAEPGDSLLDWLNALPEVRSILAAQFNGVPISKQNLSEWRAGGFLAWQIREDFLTEAQDLIADSGQLAQVAAAGDGSRLSDHLATVLAARYASLLVHWDGEVTEPFTQKLRALGCLSRAIAELRRGDQALARRQLTATGVATACRHTPINQPTVESQPARHSLGGDGGSDSVKPSQTNPSVALPQKSSCVRESANHSPSPRGEGRGEGERSLFPQGLESTTLASVSPNPGKIIPLLRAITGPAGFTPAPQPKYLKPCSDFQSKPVQPPQIILPNPNDYDLLAFPAALAAHARHPKLAMA